MNLVLIIYIYIVKVNVLDKGEVYIIYEIRRKIAYNLRLLQLEADLKLMVKTAGITGSC
jgi:hypothetical protein